VLAHEQDGNAEPLAVLLPGVGVPAEKEQQETAAAEAIQSANAMLAEYQRIRRWLCWSEPDFPRTPTGKPRLAEIARRVAETSAGRGPQRGGKDSLEELLQKFAPAGAAAPVATHLESQLNLSSLDRVELLSALEDRYQIELNETAFAEARTVDDVEQLLRQPQARRTEFSYPRWAQRAPIRWLRLAVYYALTWPATLLLAHPKITGRENLHNVAGPFLIISNHVATRADLGLLLFALPARIRHRLATAMAGEILQQMRRPPREWFFLKRWAWQAGYGLVTALFNVFPLPRQSGFRESFHFAGESADRGHSVLVFPEGEVSRDGSMAPFRGGIGLLAESLRLPVVPVRLDGLWKMKQERRRWARVVSL
ncbi:MAG: 1-acyl-sn-glycerol-3-phosphate acyltransferase, partial [Acidobacteriia bacterium]|nr:1-acyl-sn-glycerol-3-phosphate acyltransferase [Terriglobia bacterium]